MQKNRGKNSYIKGSFYILLPLSLLLTSCGRTTTTSMVDSIDTIQTDIFVPAQNSTFDWNLQDIDETTLFSDDIQIVDVDAFTTSKETVKALHKQGKKVIAYLSVGSWESYRPDKDLFPKKILGKKYPDWEDERLLNIKRIDLLAPIMKARFDMIKEKGFDGVEPDNIDVYTWDSETNFTGFSLTLKDGKKYADWLIKEAHKRGLSIGQKNAQELTEEYASKFDWALSENSFILGIEEKLKTYTDIGKAVFATEYINNGEDIGKTPYTKESFLNEVCQEADILGYTAILKRRDLDSYIVRCP